MITQGHGLALSTQKTQVDINWILAQNEQGTTPWFADENKPLKTFNKMSPRWNRV